MSHATPGGHERQDVRPAIVLAAGGGVLALVVFTLVAMWWLLGGLERLQTAERPAAHTLAAGEPARLPPEPRLQVHPLADLHALRAREDATLESYAWVDRATGRVRIPIERAMALVAQGEGR
jgi:HAMP domain-containing protein